MEKKQSGTYWQKKNVITVIIGIAAAAVLIVLAVAAGGSDDYEYISELVRPDRGEILYELEVIQGGSIDELQVYVGGKVLTDEELEQLNGYLIEIGQHIANNDMDKIVEVDTAFHDMLYTASRNERLRSIINNLREQMTTIRGRSMSYPGRLVETMDEHRNLVEAIAAHDVERAQYAARIHLENAEHTLMRSLSEHLPQKKA